jgi:glycosyltransferase involved in cell wall biosynthesis
MGGTQRVAQNFSLAYQAAGLNSELLAFYEGGPRRAVLEASGIPIFACASTQAMSNIREHVLSRHYDIVHLHGSGNYPNIFVKFLCALRERNPNALVLETNVFSRPDFSGTGKYIDLHLHLSEWGLAKWRSWTNCERPLPLGICLPNLIDENAILPLDRASVTEWRRKLNIASSAFVALRVGQPIASKWSSHAFEAFERFSDDKPDTYFVAIGMPDHFKPVVERLNRVRRRVIAIPPRFDDAYLSAAYHASNVFLHSAKIGESFGMVLAEASLAEKPVITLSRPLNDNGHVEVVRHRKTGLIANDADGMHEGLEILYGDRTFAHVLGLNGRAHIIRNYTADALIPKVMAIFTAASGQKDPGKRRAILIEAGWDQYASLAELRKSSDYLGGKPGFKEHFVTRLIHDAHLYRIYYRVRHRMTMSVRG